MVRIHAGEPLLVLACFRGALQSNPLIRGGCSGWHVKGFAVLRFEAPTFQCPGSLRWEPSPQGTPASTAQRQQERAARQPRKRTGFRHREVERDIIQPRVVV